MIKEKIMICPECEKDGAKSIVFEGYCSTTASYTQPFYDEEGRKHNHDGNVTTRIYSCSNGHEIVIKDKPVCWCGYGTEEKK